MSSKTSRRASSAPGRGRGGLAAVASRASSPSDGEISDDRKQPSTGTTATNDIAVAVAAAVAAALAPLLTKETAPSSQKATVDIAAHFAQESRERRQPFRRVEALLAAERAEVSATGKQALVDGYVDLLRASPQNFSEWECLLLSSLLLLKQEDQLVVAASFLRKQAEARATSWNFLIASLHPPSFIEAWGEKLEGLGFPLFPPHPGLATRNLQILKVSGPTGGGSPGSPALFAPHTSFSKEGIKGIKGTKGTHASSRDLDGGGYIPVGEIQGALYADTTSVESALAASQQEVGRLRAQIGGLERKLQRLQQPRGQAAYPQPQQQQQFQPPQQQQQQQPQRPQRAWRGRGAGRAVSGGDVETTPDF